MRTISGPHRVCDIQQRLEAVFEKVEPDAIAKDRPNGTGFVGSLVGTSCRLNDHFIAQAAYEPDLALDQQIEIGLHVEREKNLRDKENGADKRDHRLDVEHVSRDC